MDFGSIVADIFGFEKNLIKETEMKDMKWKAKNLIKKSINVIERNKSNKVSFKWKRLNWQQ